MPIKRWLAVHELAGQTAAVVETYDDDRRLYLAPFDQLGEAKPVVLMDSSEYGGPKFEKVDVVIGPEVVVVLFTTEKVLHGLYVNGKVRGPITPG